MAKWQYTQGLHEIGDGTWAWLQPDGSWGWSNAGLITDSGQSLLVDTLFDVPLTAHMLTAMRDASADARDINSVVNTHANGDHCWGNQLVEGAEIIASRRGAEELAEVDPALMAKLMKAARLVTASGPLGRGAGWLFSALGAKKLGALAEAAPFVDEVFGHFDFGSISLTPPTRTFDTQLGITVGSRAVQLLEVGPAHTKGDVLVHVPDTRTVFTGDILFIGGHPIVWQGPFSNWVAACERILKMDVAVIIPGHGPPTDKAGVTAVRDYLAHVHHEASERFKAGMSVFDAAVDISLDGFETWSEAERIVINVDTVYRELDPTREPPDVLEAFALMARVKKALGRSPSPRR